MKYNFNLDELREVSKTNADILFHLALGLYHGKKVESLNPIIEKLNLDDYPTVDTEKYVIPEYGTGYLYVIYYCKNPNSYIKSLDVFDCAVSDKGKVRYLELCSLCNTSEKFIPSLEVPNELIVYGLVRPVPEGFILTLER